MTRKYLECENILRALVEGKWQVKEPSWDEKILGFMKNTEDEITDMDVLGEELSQGLDMHISTVCLKHARTHTLPATSKDPHFSNTIQRIFHSQDHCDKRFLIHRWTVSDERLVRQRKGKTIWMSSNLRKQR